MLNNYTLRNGNDGDNVNCKGNDNDVNDNFEPITIIVTEGLLITVVLSVA